MVMAAIGDHTDIILITTTTLAVITVTDITHTIIIALETATCTITVMEFSREQDLRPNLPVETDLVPVARAQVHCPPAETGQAEAARVSVQNLQRQASSRTMYLPIRAEMSISVITAGIGPSETAIHGNRRIVPGVIRIEAAQVQLRMTLTE